MEPFYILKSILNHHCTVWWYSLYFRKLELSSLSKPGDARKENEKPRQKEREKEQKTEENKEGHL